MTLQQLIDRDGPACVWCGRRLWRSDLTAAQLALLQRIDASLAGAR